MPPTDCFDDAGSSCVSMGCGGPESRMLPTTRSPFHHGTDPDLSAPTPVGVAATGLDLSPVMGPTHPAVATKAKRKLRVSAATGGSGGGGPSPVQAARLSRGFPSPGIYKSNTVPPPSARDTCIRTLEQTGPSPSAGAEAKATSQKQQPEKKAGLADGEKPPTLVPLGSAGVVVGRDHALSARSELQTRSSVAPQQQQQPQKKDLDKMMDKAKKASDHIRALLHAQRCEGGSCQVPGCEQARNVVEHMRGCNLPEGVVCGNPQCVQARKMLRHFEDCAAKRLQGRRGSCLVCCMVSRSASTPNGASPAFSGTPPTARQPLGYLGPGTSYPRRGLSVQQPEGRAAAGKGQWGDDAGLPSPVVISRARRGAAADGNGVGLFSQFGQSQMQQGLRGVPRRRPPQQQQQCLVRSVPKDGKFFRPLPKTRRGSWGGCDRYRYPNRARFDSIPEEVPEEDGEGDGDDIASETASDAGSKSTAGDVEGRNKTLLSSMSL